MTYNMNEGTLTLPFDYADNSMTILKFPAEQSSLTIVRGEMPPEHSLADTVELQKNLFKREFKTVVLGDTKSTTFGHSPSLDAMEFFCQFERVGVKQFQMNLLIKQQANFITVSYTQMRAFSNEDLTHWEQIKSNFVPNPQWYQQITGETA